MLLPKNLRGPVRREPAQNVQPPQAYVNFVLEVPAGSFVYGFYHGSVQNFTMQVTDLGLGYKWFNTPIPDSVFLSTRTARTCFRRLTP